MNLYLLALRIHVPVFVRKKMLRELFELTARAFQCAVPGIKNLSCEGLLKEYALFTAEQSEKAVRESRDLQDIKQRLYQNAYQAGAKLRKCLRIRNTEEVMLISRLFYRILGIEFRGNAGGEITIGACYFSTYYSSRVCRIVSSLDEGMAAGLSGGGAFSFLQRMTEGNDRCTARLSPATDTVRRATAGGTL